MGAQGHTNCPSLRPAPNGLPPTHQSTPPAHPPSPSSPVACFSSPHWKHPLLRLLNVQAAYKGHLACREAARLRADLLERRRRQLADEAAAREVIAPWAATFALRTRFLRIQRATRALQRWWHREFARRQAAAVAMQTAARRMLAVRRLGRCRAAAVAIQAAWRGHHERATHPKRRRAAETRRRLAAATAAAPGNAHRTLGARTSGALDALLAASPKGAAPLAALEALALCTEAARGCCDAVAARGGIPALLELVRAAQRSKQQTEQLRGGVTCLANLCRWRWVGVGGARSGGGYWLGTLWWLGEGGPGGRAT